MDKNDVFILIGVKSDNYLKSQIGQMLKTSLYHNVKVSHHHDNHDHQERHDLQHDHHEHGEDQTRAKVRE